MIVSNSQIKPDQVSANDESRLEIKSINFRSLAYGLQIIIKGQSSNSKKIEIQIVLEQFKETQDPKVCRKLDEPEYLQLTKIRSFIKFFRLAFIDLTNHVRQYFKYQNKNIIEKIVQFQLQLDINDLKESYRIQLKKLQEKEDWSDKFIEDWMTKAIQMQSKEKLPFQNGFKSENKQQNNVNSFKRSSPTKQETQTEASQAPKKKLKKDSLNYKSVIKALQTMIRCSRDQKRQQLQHRLDLYMQTEDGEHLRIKDVDICRKLFDLRSYMKHFADAFVQITNKDQYRVFADKNMLLKIFDVQEYIDPCDILTSYKRIIAKKQQEYGWTKQMIREWIDKVIELKKKQIEILSKRS